MNIDNEIRELKEKLDKLENVKKEMERNKNKNISVEDNLTVIHNIIQNKKLAIMKNKYSKVVPLSSYYDSELVAHLEATYNILRELNFAIKNK
jgi:hypothetical protein